MAETGGGGSSNASPQPKRRPAEVQSPLPKFFLSLEKSESHFLCPVLFLKAVTVVSFKSVSNI